MVGRDAAGGRRHQGIDAIAGGEGTSGAGGVQGAGREGTCAATAHIRLDLGGRWSHGSSLAVFQGVLLLGTVDLAEVIDASIVLGLGTCFHEVRNGDRSQQTDDGDDNHDFNEGKTRFTCGVFHTFTDLVVTTRCERSIGRVI